MANRFSGVHGRLLDVDLTNRTHGDYVVPDDWYEQYLGGKALAVRILWDLNPPGVDPLAPENTLVFTTGTLTGSGAPAASRFNLSTKNLLTGGIASSNCGGDFGIHLKRAGYDGLILRGRCDAPTWLAIDERGVRFLDARHLWGLDVEPVQEHLPRKAGHIVIGPAGENLVRYAAIVSGERVLGRGGVGAILGSKNLKVVTATGSRHVHAHDPERFSKAVEKWVHILRSHSITGEQLPKYGSAGLVSATNATNTLPTRNFQKSHFEFAEEISGEHLADTYLLTNDGCSSCPIRCARVVKHGGKAVKGPEFETVGMFGSNIDNRDLPNILEWNWLADQLGMDTISLGSTLATAMELKEQGRFPELPVSFGHFEGMEQLMRDIALRRGIGDELAEGSFRLAIRRGDPELAMHAKGMEFAAYDPRGAVGHGLGYATANRGGCHINGGYLIFFEALGPVNVDPHTTKGKPELAVFQQNFLEAVSACGGCTFPTYSVVPDLPKCLSNAHGTMARLLNKTLQASGFLLHKQGKLKPTSLGFHLPLIPHTNAIEALTGMRMKLGTFTAVGERGFTLERLFNLREGMTTRDDSLPRRLTHEPQDPGRPETVVPLAEMLPVYYEVRDWDAKGVPTPDLVAKLSLDFARPLVDELRADPDARVAIRRGWLDRGDVLIQRLLVESRRVAEDAAQRRDELERAFDRTRATEWAARVRRATFRIDPARCRKCGICAGKCPVGAIAWQRGGLASIDPAKCIRCGVCAQVCPPHFDAVLMPDAAAGEDRGNVRYRVIEDKCRMCGACFKPCPVGAITWKIKEKAVVDADLCVACGRCFAKCPTKFAAIEKVSV